MTLDPGTLGAISQFALAAFLVLIAVGIFSPKWAVDFLKDMLKNEQAESKAAQEALAKNNNTLEKMTESQNRTAVAVEKLVEMMERGRA